MGASDKYDVLRQNPSPAHASVAPRAETANERPLRILSFTTLYPNAVRPHHGVFVETRLRHLAASGQASVEVVAPVPWFPLASEVFGRYAELARVPGQEQRHGIEVHHPRYPLLPKVGMTMAPALLAAAALPALRRMLRGGTFDLIDAHYFYPDGVSAALLGAWLGKPVVITARGTDINLIPRHRLPRRMILWAAGRAAAVIGVCAALRDELVRLGVPSARVTVLRNGVDLTLFRPLDRETERARLGWPRPALLSVGLLTERKGHHLVIEALTQLPDLDLVIVGDGEERARLAALARALGVGERVRFAGVVPADRLKHYYSAAEALVLASSREGWANVLLEAMACGTPVVATPVWGTPEVVAAPEAGVLAQERTPQALAAAVRRLQARYPDRAATRRYAERFGWDDTTRGQLELFRAVRDREPGA